MSSELNLYTPELPDKVDIFIKAVASLSLKEKEEIESLFSKVLNHSCSYCIFIDNKGAKCGKQSVVGEQYCPTHLDTPSCGGTVKITGLPRHDEEEKEEEYIW